MPTAVIGREDELGAIRAFLRLVEQGPAALVLSGEAGIGKTILWQTGVDEARERFARVLTCRGIGAEASLSFAGLSNLLDRTLDGVGPSLAPPRRRALEVALLLVEPGDRPPDSHAIGLAVLDVLRELVRQGPLLVALDDFQWLDAASATALQIALRRLQDEPIGLLATVRRAPQLEQPFELERSLPEGRVERISLGPLSLGALHGLLDDRLGLELTRPELARLQEASTGNPFFALEIGRELVRTGTRPAAGRMLQVSASLRELIGGRLSRLPAETVDVLLEVAALAQPTIELVTAADGDPERVLRGLEAALREGVVEVDDSGVRFTHPLLASICYEQAPVWKRRAVHRTLAGAVPDLEERARHLALAAEGPDAAVASELDAAAERAAARGATAAAAQLCELAAQLTPDDPAALHERCFRAACFHRLAGESERAAAILQQLLTEVPAGGARADVLCELALTYRSDMSRTIALLNEALAEAGEDNVRATKILGFRSLYRQLEVNVHAALADARDALARAERTEKPDLIASAIARVAHVETSTAQITPGLLERGVEIVESLQLELEFLNSPQYHIARLAMRMGQLDTARTNLEQLEAASAARGDEISRVVSRFYLSIVEWVAGRWPQAEHHAVVACEAGEQAQFAHTPMWGGRVLALVQGDLGRIDHARATAHQGLGLARSTGNDAFALQILGVLGRIELELGDLKMAGDYLRDLPEQLLAGGWTDPVQTMWADAIETLVALGELERARSYLGHFDENAQLLGSPWALAAAARCHGVFAGGEGDLQTACSGFEKALAILEGHPFPLEHGRTLLCLGIVRRQAQQKRSAREALQQALAILESLPAPLWAEKARAELRRISGRRPADEELTETERRVAELAAQGRTNKEIAAELFMGVSTVEAHLSRVYRKLGIRSRSGLGARLAKPKDETVQA